MSSLIKFMNQVDGGERGRLHWNRADVDGAPYRGHFPITGTAEELEQRLTRVSDSHNRIFDTSDPRENKEYMAVMDKITNGWAQCLHRHHEHLVEKIKGTDGIVRTRLRVIIYVEWSEYYMEDGKPNLAQRPYVGRPNDD